MAKFCPNCGTKIIENSKFCHECGYAVNNIMEEKTTNIDDKILENIQQMWYGNEINTIDNNSQLINNNLSVTTNENTDDDFFSQLGNIQNKEIDEENNLLQKAEDLFINYKLETARDILFNLYEKGNLKAKYLLGLLYESGYAGLKTDIEKAVNLFAEAGDNGEVLAYIPLLEKYINEETKNLVPNLNKSILEQIDKLETSDNPIVQCEIGIYYYTINSEKINYDKAFYFLKQAADKGYWRALGLLGAIKLSGEFGVPDINEGLQYLEKASLKGDKVSAFILGSTYVAGIVVPKDVNKAKRWLSIAAEQNDSDALQILAKILLNEGYYPMVISCYQKDVDVNLSSSSALSLSELFLGINSDYPNFPENLDRGFNLLKKAIQLDETNAEALIFFALYQENANNIENAKKYYQKAYNFGNDEIKSVAKEALLRLNNSQTKTNTNDGCFITTAVCENFSKPDDCYELIMFRNFRDNWLSKQIDGKQLITEYYSIAPKIVKKINNLSNAKEIYQQIWEKYLKSCLYYLEQKDEKSCKRQYIQMVLDLKNEYI